MAEQIMGGWSTGMDEYFVCAIAVGAIIILFDSF